MYKNVKKKSEKEMKKKEAKYKSNFRRYVLAFYSPARVSVCVCVFVCACVRVYELFFSSYSSYHKARALPHAAVIFFSSLSLRTVFCF